MNNQNLKSKLQQFRYNDDVVSPKKSISNQISKVTKVHTVKKKLKSVKPQNEIATRSSSSQSYPDLQPSLTKDQILLFVGYNPGVESSVRQHHYAHFTNSFWKLFNESQLFIKVVNRIEPDYIDKNIKEDELLKDIMKDGKSSLKPHHDFDIIKYKIGFTDLVLRCTKTAQELSLQEKLDNIPRLIDEFNYSNTSYIILIGKGIWEMFIKYMTNELNIKKFKLTKLNFTWGEQEINQGERLIEEVRMYNIILKNLKAKIDNKQVKIFVFPNTSGLVTSLKHHEKLALWNDLVSVI
ncbi:uracil-DNA glycosylase-like protein [Scheffersomyces coipomensis]|uniref:uracil-DNA glycosylase-like protein n=1 Tax=Scheffersomyces coipomensis TaxID=1788519 RepID=UPI00315CDF9B